MTSEELDQLRGEATAFLHSVQALSGFASRREELAPPPVALSMPLWSVRRVLAFPEDPIETDAAQQPLGTGLLAGEGERPRPTAKEITELLAYERRLRIFSERYLSRPQWGARAIHVALQRGESIVLPPAAPDIRVPLPHSSVSGRELNEIAKSFMPKKELRKSRQETWAGAVAAIEQRLRIGKAASRDPFTRAARYLNAAVNGRVGKRREYVEPLEPSDSRHYEREIEKRFRSEDRLREVRRALPPEEA